MENNVQMLRPDGNDVVMIELDRPRELKLGHKAMKRFSALTGCSMEDMEKEIKHYDKLACLMYVMLAVDAEKHGETLTTDQVDDLLEPVCIPRQLELCMAAIQAAFDDPDASKEETGGNPPQAAGTGG